jgi:hypothetical protein
MKEIGGVETCPKLAEGGKVNKSEVSKILEDLPSDFEYMVVIPGGLPPKTRGESESAEGGSHNKLMQPSIKCTREGNPARPGSSREQKMALFCSLRMECTSRNALTSKYRKNALYII